MENYKRIKNIIPLLLIVGVMPLISYGKVDILSGNTFMSWTGKSSEIDFFSYYRMVFTVIMSVVALILFLIKRRELNKLNPSNEIVNKFKNIPEYKFIIVYTICILMSFAFSDYKDIAMKGFVFRYEGTIATLSYMMLLLLSINTIDDELKSKSVIAVLTVSSVVIGVVGICQYFGHDIFQNLSVQKFMIPKNHDYMVGNLKFFLDENTKVYSTLGNSNYIGSYFALILPILITLGLFAKKNRIKFIIASIINLLVLVFSDSAAGVMSVAISMFILVIFKRKKLLNEYKKVSIVAGCIFIGLLALDFSTSKVLYTKTKNAVNEFVYEINVGKEKEKLEDVLIGGNTAQIEFKDKGLILESYNDELIFKDKNNKNLKVVFDKKNNCWNFEDKRYRDANIEFVTINESGTKFIRVNIDDDISINLTTVNDEFKYITYGGRVIDKKDIKYWGGDGLEELLTSRVYIWSRIFPLIAEKPVFGHGADTFAAVFPQYDYVGMYKAYDRTGMIVDKAHNMYVQIAEGTGVISLIAFLGLIFVYIRDSIKRYFNSENNYNILGLAIFTGIIGYLISGIFNDSVVFVAPIFYILLGMGISFNKRH